MTQQFVISLEGNIGAGKSTLIKKITTAATFIEDVSEWKDSLVSFYENPTQNKTQFQHVILSYLLARHVRISKSYSKIVVMERSIGSNEKIFKNDISDTFYSNALEIARNVGRVDLYLFLDTDVNVCYERVKKRARPGEESITLEYLQMLHDKQNKWINDTDWFERCGSKMQIISDTTDIDNLIKNLHQ